MRAGGTGGCVTGTRLAPSTLVPRMQSYHEGSLSLSISLSLRQPIRLMQQLLLWSRIAYSSRPHAATCCACDMKCLSSVDSRACPPPHSWPRSDECLCVCALGGGWFDDESARNKTHTSRAEYPSHRTISRCACNECMHICMRNVCTKIPQFRARGIGRGMDASAIAHSHARAGCLSHLHQQKRASGALRSMGGLW